MAPGKKRDYTILVSVALFIGLEIAAFGMLRTSSVMSDIWINRISHRTMAFLWKKEESFKSYFALNRKLEAVTRENEELSRIIREFRQQGMRISVEEPEKSDGYVYTQATIVKMSRNNQHNYIIIDKGSADGVESGDGIITSRGVVGIVDAVDKHLAYAQSFINVSSKVSARIGRNGVTGPMSWNGRTSNGAVLYDLPLHISTTPEDTIFTSGISAIFPPDIPLGTAGRMTTVNGATNSLEVKLFQDFTTVRFVTVVKKIGKDRIKKLEESNKD